MLKLKTRILSLGDALDEVLRLIYTIEIKCDLLVHAKHDKIFLITANSTTLHPHFMSYVGSRNHTGGIFVLSTADGKAIPIDKACGEKMVKNDAMYAAYPNNGNIQASYHLHDADHLVI